MAAKSGIEALMKLVCAEWCLGKVMHGDGEVSDVTQLIPKEGKVSADQFVEWVFLASGEEARGPEPMWSRARAEIRAAFIRHMGGEIVDARALRWDAVDPIGRTMLPLTDPVAFARNLTDAELEEEMNVREDWRDRLIAERELQRRRRPPWLMPLWWALCLIGLTLAAWLWGRL